MSADLEQCTVRRRSRPSVYFDSNGVLTERRRIGGREYVVRYDDLPDSDFCIVDGIRCTTPLRTVIDLAIDLDPAELRRIVRDCISRGMFTVEEAKARVAQPDLVTRRGAQLLAALLSTEGGC